jgi:molybdate transport system regulatory protein
MKMSYKQAWEIIKHMNDHFAMPIVISSRGGKGGGNASVTEDGLRLIKQYRALQQKFTRFLTSNINELL